MVQQIIGSNQTPNSMKDTAWSAILKVKGTEDQNSWSNKSSTNSNTSKDWMYRQSNKSPCAKETDKLYQIGCTEDQFQFCKHCKMFSFETLKHVNAMGCPTLGPAR